ncbi:MAG: radical SAM protein [Crenarchaeota archaeon]|nr:radical SAM protein [Thermoproteota archaeon]
MVGTRAFGIVDMGTNIIEVRPTSLCPLSCIFCSVNAGPRSRIRWAEYVVDVDVLVEAVREVVQYKGCKRIEIHVDGMGEPGTYPYLVDLVQELKDIDGVRVISMQTRLVTLNEKKLLELSEAGLDRFNVSIDAVDPDKARHLAGTEWYNVERVIELVKYVVENTRSDVVFTPVWVPGINDDEIPKIIELAKSLKVGKRWPPVLIQKYVPHKHGRKVPVRDMSWREFFKKLKDLETKFNIRLIPSPEDFDIHKERPLPQVFRRGETIKVRVIDRGIFINEYLALPLKLSGSHVQDRSITVIASSKLENVLIGQKIKVRIIENRNNIYIAEPVDF